MRTLAAVLSATAGHGPLWPPRLAVRLVRLGLRRMPRGLVVEPSTRCLAGCSCCIPSEPRELAPDELSAWLDCAPVPPVTVNLAGKHSDPLASGSLGGICAVARRKALAVSISTNGAGMTPEAAALPFDRWIFGLPGATRESYEAVRGVDGFDGVIEGMRMVLNSSRAMVEAVLTVWKPSAGDREAFDSLMESLGVAYTRAVPGIFDPSGNDVGRAEMLAIGDASCPYRLDPGGGVSLSREPGPCPALGYLFLDASAVLRPCPYCDRSDPSAAVPSRNAWLEARSWKASKKARHLSQCRWCP